MPADEAMLGVPAPPQEDAGKERGKNGTFVRGAKVMQSAGGKACSGRSYLTSRLGMAGLPENAPFMPYRISASGFRKRQCAELAKTVGGGMCGPGPSSIVVLASIALAWSRYFSDLAAKTKKIKDQMDYVTRSVRYGETSRQHLLAAHELCAREALARPRKEQDILGAFRSLPPAAPKVKPARETSESGMTLDKLSELDRGVADEGHPDVTKSGE